MRHSRLGFVVAPVLVVALAGSAVVLVHRRNAVARSAAVVAVVDDSSITTDDLDVRLEQILPAASYHGHVEPARLLSLKRAALDDLVLDALIFREARNEGRRAPAAAIDAEMAAVKARFDDASRFAAALHEAGLTERDFRERLARTIVVREARAAHASQTITEPEIETYYREHAARFQRPERVHLLEILLRADPAEPASAVASERKARAILGRLRHGEAFAPLAREWSEDEYRVKDGDMGFVHRGRLDAEFESAAFAAVPGRIGLARSLYGFEVFKVIERQPPAQLSLEEARPIIARGLERQRREDGVRRWHERLLAGALVVITDPVLRNARAAELPPESVALGSLARSKAAAGGQQ